MLTDQNERQKTTRETKTAGEVGQAPVSIQSPTDSLIEAVKQNNGPEFSRLLALRKAEKIDIDEEVDDEGNTALYWAVVNGHDHFIGPLVKAGAAVNKKNNEGMMTPIIAAVACNKALAIKEFRAAGVNLSELFCDVGDGNRRSLSSLAASLKKSLVIDALCQAGVSVDIPDTDGQTPIFAAVEAGDVLMIQHLHQLGANLNQENNAGIRPIHRAAAEGMVAVIIALHRANKAVVDAQDSHGATPVYTAALMGKSLVIPVLKMLGANVNTPNNDGETPVGVAAARGHAEIIKELEAADADMNTPKNDGRTPAIVAVTHGHAEVITALKAADVDMSQQVKIRPSFAGANCEELLISPFLMAVYSGNQAIVDAIIAPVMRTADIAPSAIAATVTMLTQLNLARDAVAATLAIVTQPNPAGDAANNNRGAAGSSQGSNNLKTTK